LSTKTTPARRIGGARYGQEGHGPYELISIGELALEEGGSLPDCRLAVATHGRLNAAKDNAILVPTWYSGTSKIIEQVYIGEGRALDPSKYFIVVVNQIGNGLSSSPHNSGASLAGPAFPKVRIGDDVRAQHKLLTEKFGLTSLALVVGGSMGGRYDSPADVAASLKRHAKLWTVMGWSTDFFRAGRHRALGFESVQALVDTFMTGYFAPMDSNNLLAMAWKWQRGDVSRHAGGDIAAALGRIKAKSFVMPISHDMFFPPTDCEAEQKLIPGSSFRPPASIDGHLGLFGTDAALLAELRANLKELLATGTPAARQRRHGRPGDLLARRGVDADATRLAAVASESRLRREQEAGEDWRKRLHRVRASRVAHWSST
jgi:homoserine O-acetyltransferase